MPQQWIEFTDEYVEWGEGGENDYKGVVGLIGGVVTGVIYDPGQDPVIYPPAPYYVKPPNGTPPSPPKVKRVKVPPPSYP